MNKSISQVTNNLWQPSNALLDGPVTVKSPFAKPQSFESLQPQTPGEKNFLAQNGPIHSESWKQNLPPKKVAGSTSHAVAKPAGPLDQMLPSTNPAKPNHPVLPNGTPNKSFYLNQANQLGSRLATMPTGPKSGAFSNADLAILKLQNPIAHDRYVALPSSQQQGINSIGPMNNLTMFIPKAGGNEKSNIPSRLNPRTLPNDYEEVFAAIQPKNENPKVLGTRQVGDHWYLFGTEVESPQKNKDPVKSNAASWFAPEDFLGNTSKVPRGK